MNQNITRSMLLDSFIFGKAIALIVWSDSLNRSIKVNGVIVGLSVESGYAAGGHLRDFMFTIQEKGGSSYVGYVKTID
jgi:hypothetical protein